MSCPGQLQLNLHCTAFPAAYCKQEAQKNPGKTQEKPGKPWKTTTARTFGGELCCFCFNFVAFPRYLFLYPGILV